MVPQLKIKKKQVRRGGGFSKKCTNRSFKIIGNNSAGLSGKKDSFENLIKEFSPGVVMIQETKLYKKGTIQVENYSVFENIRGKGEGGGLLTLVHSNLEPTRRNTKMCQNFLIVEAKLKNKRSRFLNAYGVQETATIEEKSEFYSILDEEICLTLNAGHMLCLEMDANAKLGNRVIKGDPHQMSSNGKQLFNLVERYNLVVVNATDRCFGIITRIKRMQTVTEESILDYFIVCQEFYLMVTSLKIDEDRKYVLTKFVKSKKRSYTVESDHNPLIMEVDISWDMKVKMDRVEIYNLRNSECQEKFFHFTNNSDMLTKCLIDRDVKYGGKLWLKSLKFAIMQNFRKVRLTSKKTSKSSEINQLLNKRRLEDSCSKIQLDDQVADKIFERNRKMIIEQVGSMVDTSSNLSRIKMWKIKQRVCPKQDVTYAVAKSNKNGEMVTNKTELKNLYVETYRERLKHREMKPAYAQLKDLKENLFNVRIKLSKMRKTEHWKQSDLLKVTKHLKTKKASDPKGLVSEIFKPNVAGTDLFESLLLLCNKVKEECEIPTFLEWTNISSIYKRKGLKTDLNNDRGVFNVMTVRSIIDNLIYNDYYDCIDDNMSDSNVGGRRDRNIRDNLFIVYGIINYAIRNNLEIEINLYDLAKCFDSMWYQETMNDLWDTGVQDNKFALVAKMNDRCNIAIKTPIGITDRFQLDQIEMQGTKFSNIKCSVQIDTLGKECYSSGEGLFLYKSCVYVPPLGMIDDIVSFALSGLDAIKTNAIVNAKIESKKLEFGPTKCYNIHIGENEDTIAKAHENIMKVKDYETYLGDIICKSGSNEKNIENRRNQGLGAISEISSMLDRVSLGHFHFDIALILRDSILISKLVFNSEIWYNLTDQQLVKLEQIDEMYFRQVFNVAKSTPREGLYLECGSLPIRFIVKIRRIMYYWHLVNRDSDELILKFYTAQSLDPSKGDWALQAMKDMKDINLHLDEEKIKTMSKERFKNIVKQKVEKMGIMYLEKLKNSHSKTEFLSMKKFSPQEYLKSKSLNISEVQNLFKLRNKMIDVKENFKSSSTNSMWCRVCYLFRETQHHLLDCSPIRTKLKDIINFESLSYNMIFGSLKNQEKFAKNYSIILSARQDILDDNAPDCG